MEDNLNGRQPQWKIASMEDGRPQLNRTSMEDDHNGRRPHWKMTSMEPKMKINSIEEYIIGSQPQWKPYRKQ